MSAETRTESPVLAPRPRARRAHRLRPRARPLRHRAARRHAARHARHARRLARRRRRSTTWRWPAGWSPASSTTTTRCPATTRSRSPAPGVERALRTPAHFRREVGKVVAIRLADVGHDERRVTGTLVAADDTSATVTVDCPTDRTSGPSGTTRSTAPRPCSSGRLPSRRQARPRSPARTAQEEEGALVVSNLDMSEAIRLLAQEKGLSEDSLLHVLVDALASAYKRRPGAADEVVVEVDPDTMEFTFTAYDLDEDGNWVNERDDTPKQRRARPHRRPDVPPGDEPAHPRGRARPQVRGVRQPRGRHRHRHHPADRHPLHAARPRPRRGAAAAGRAGAVRAPAAGRPLQGVHRRGPARPPRARRSSSAAPTRA